MLETASKTVARRSDFRKGIVPTSSAAMASRRMTVVFVACLLGTACVVSGFPAAAHAQLGRLEEQAFKEAAALASPAVVRIETVGGLDRVGNVLTVTGPTTGVVVSSDGYIISSAFNFISRPASILVQLPDGRRFAAEQVATDWLKMLTLLRIDADDLTPTTPAPTDSLRVGQWAIAMGRTYDPEVPNVSVGIVSALERIWGKAVQTDAKVSPVNYGGPLVDLKGETIGVLVPLSPQQSGETAGVEWYDSGIGFAIPMEDVYGVAERLKDGNDLRAGLLGIAFGGDKAVGAEPIIDRVRTASPADEAGLEAGDRILKIDGATVARRAEVQFALGGKYAGDRLSISVARAEEILDRELTLVAELLPYESGFLGILPARGADDEASEGVVVRYVYRDSPADAAGLEVRDRIVTFNGTAIQNGRGLVDLVGRLRPEETAAVVYKRDNVEHIAEVQLATLPESVPAELTPSVIPPFAGDEQRDVETGRFNSELAGSGQSYWAYVPEDYNPDYGYGLVVWIHPGGNTMEGPVFNAWKPICDQRGLILLGLRASSPEGWQPNELVMFKEAVDEMRAKYNIDAARTVLHGFGDGGELAFELAFKYRELFRGVSATGAALRKQPPENDPDFRIQIHLCCGARDEAYRRVEVTVEALRKLKFPVIFTTIDDYEHAYPPTEQIREIGRWVDGLDRI